MQARPTCLNCGGTMWLVVQQVTADPASRFECFHCHDQDPEPKQQRRLAAGLRRAFARLGRLGRLGRRRIAPGVMANTSARPPSSHSTSRGPSQSPGRGTRMQKPTTADAVRDVSFFHCDCGHPTSVQNLQPDDRLRVFCVGCGRSLEYRPDRVRRVSVAIPSLSLRDFKFPGPG
jgi:hypothetical protein